MGTWSGLIIISISTTVFSDTFHSIYYTYTGPVAQRKKALVKEGKLDKYGRKNDQTPSDYLSMLGGKPASGSSSSAVVVVAAEGAESATEAATLTEGGSAEKDKKKKKKKKDKEDGDESPIHKKSKA